MIDQKRVILLSLMLSVASCQYAAFPVQTAYGWAHPHDTINQRHTDFFWANVRYLPKDAPVPFHTHGWHDVYSHDHYNQPHHNTYKGCGCGGHVHIHPPRDYVSGCLNLCPKTGSTVCGSDGVTYANLCRMSCYGATCAGTGICNNSGILDCSKCDRTIFSPVCADNTNYFNSCWAQCNNRVITATTCCDNSTTSCYTDALNRLNFK